MVTMIMLASPIVAPSIGAFLLRFGWPSIFIFKAVYSSVLAFYYLFFVSETRPGKWRNISLSSTLRQCAGVVTRRVDGKRLPMRYAFTMALSASAFMTFLTNSSFTYIEFFGVSESMFPLYFGVSIVGLMGSNLFSMRRLTRSNSARFFQIGIRMQGMSVALLLAVVFFGAGSIWLVVLPVAIMVASFGLTGPAGSSEYMGFFVQLAGSASSVYTTLMFSSGAIFGGVSGLFFNGSLWPMVLTMFVASMTANLLAMSIRARSGQIVTGV